MIAFPGLISDHLPTVVEQYIEARDLCPKQQQRLRSHANRFHSWLGERDEQPADETEVERLNGWLSHLSRTYSPSSVNGYRQSILSLLRHATPDGAPLPRADRIRRQKEPDKVKHAFTMAEIEQMLRLAPHYVMARAASGEVIPKLFRPDGLRWADWWEAFVGCAYDSGQYASDLCVIPWTTVGRDGAVTFVRHKTGRMISFRLSERSIEAARKLGHPELVLPWFSCMRSTFGREFRKFVQYAGVRKLGSKSIRRSAITYTYVEQGEEAARLLAGHSSFATTAKHYIDWSIARRPIAQPPRLPNREQVTQAEPKVVEQVIPSPNERNSQPHVPVLTVQLRRGRPASPEVEKRRQNLVQLLSEQPHLNTNELGSLLGVTRSCIQEDIRHLRGLGVSLHVRSRTADKQIIARRRAVAAMRAGNPSLTITEIAECLNVSARTVDGDLLAMKRASMAQSAE